MNPLSRRLPAVLIPFLFALAVALPASVSAQPGRVAVTVLDPEGKPLGGVSILVTTPERGDVNVKATTNSKGKATVMVPNVTLVYDADFELAGYETLRTQLKSTLGETTFKEFRMVPAGASAPPPAEAATATTPQVKFTPAELVFNEGVDALGKRDLDTALAKFLEAQKLDPEMAAVYSALSAIYLEKEQPQEALTAAKRFLESEPDNPRGLRVIYEANKQLGNKAEADKALKALQSQKGADVATLLYNEGADALKLGDLDSAQARFEEALAAKPDFRQANEALMVVYGRKNDWAGAAAQAEKALASDPGNLRALRMRHDAYTRLGDKAKEKEAFDALAKADPAALAGALLDSGINKFNANDTTGAIADLDSVVQLDPNRSSAHYYLGLCYTNTSKPDLAKKHLQRFLELAPDDPNAAGAREMLKYLK